MSLKFRRWVARLLVPLFVFGSVVSPRPAHAVVPLVAPIAMQIWGIGGAVLASDALASAGTAILGGIAMAVIFSIGGDNPVTVRLPVQSDQAKTDAAMPPPSAPATATQTTVPMYTTGGYTRPSALEACQAYGATIGGYTGLAEIRTTSCGSGSCCWVQAYQGGSNQWFGNLSVSVANVATCPTGYTVSGGNCTLTTARQATTDGKVDYTRSGAGYAAIPDIDTSKGSGSRQMVGGSVQTWGRDASGAPTVVTTGVDANGNTTVQVQRGLTSAGGQSLVKTDTYVINGTSGAVQSAASTAAAGSIGFDAASGAPVVSSGATVTPAEAPALNIPTDYNRETTQQSINTKTTETAASTKTLADKFAAGELTPAAPFSADAMAPLKPDPGAVQSWVSSLMSKIGLPAGGQCANASIQSELLGRSITLSFVSFCNALAPIINWFAWVLVVFAVWRAVHRVSGAASSEFVGVK